jgi:hypothetical protein
MLPRDAVSVDPTARGFRYSIGYIAAAVFDCFLTVSVAVYPTANRSSKTVAMRLIVGLIALCFLLLPGCTGISYKGGDALKDVYTARVQKLRESYGASGDLEHRIELAKKDDSGRTRNELLNDFIFLIDNNYNFWAKTTYNKKALADFGSDFSAATLSTLSGIVTGGGVQGAKSLLSFVAAGITSTKASFNLDVLQNQNLVAILAQTRKLRAEKLLVLTHGMYYSENSGNGVAPPPRPLVNYSVEQGLVDLASYYHAGSFIAALEDITDQAGKQKAEADKVINEGIKKVPKLSEGF